MQLELEKAEAKVARLSQKIASTRARAREARSRSRRMFREAEQAPLITERTAMRMQAAEVEAGAIAIENRLPALESKLERAESSLVEARANAQGASFDPGTSVFLASPEYQNGYVFPVGGGPSRVSVAHTHHDYPAADIAAPQGSPVYALADGVVLRAWSSIDPLCGIGLRFQSDDGQSWAYCHLSYIEPSLKTGTRLTAGAPVGLVGSTGHSTGPHLHLGLIPSSRGYPQNEAWFRSFAGIAFRWQDAPTPIVRSVSGDAGSQGIFTVVGDSASDEVALARSWSAESVVQPSAKTRAAAPSDPLSSPFEAVPSGNDSASGAGGAGTGGQDDADPFG
jgi:murein DD-endopeptidase MepM/ murein hydrolase activator NlpD